MNYNGICPFCFRSTGGRVPCPHCGADAARLPHNPQHLRPGTLLGKNYLIGQALGQGGFGITYKALDLSASRVVAIKEYFPNGLVTRERGLYALPVNEQAGNRMTKGVNLFFKEALILANFSAHPNIVNVLHFFRENYTAYIVMEYLRGKSLKEYLSDRGGSISFLEAEQILSPIMIALNELHHEGLLHRDVAPDNIYLTVDGHTKLLDFGAARFHIGDETQNAFSVIKPGYAPLEQYSGSDIEQGSWSDVYAMGATFYRALSGRLPTPASDRALGRQLPGLRSLGVSLPEMADKAILHAMNLRPEERYVSILNFEQDIVRAAAEWKQSDSEPPVSRPIPAALPMKTLVRMPSQKPEPENKKASPREYLQHILEQGRKKLKSR